MARYGIVVLLGLVVGSPIDSATLTVERDGSGAYTSIQDAIDAAVPGVDDVRVGCGRYVENLVMRDGVSVRGVDPACAFVEPLDAALAVVTMDDVGAGTELSGLTVENRPSAAAGSAGIRIDGGAPTITRNVIRGPGSDSAQYSGPGVYAVRSGPVITRNVIRDNHECCLGGGVTVAYVTGATVRDNLVYANAGYYGGGVYFGWASTGVVSNNTITDNEGWVGGGLFVYGDATVANNLIAYNTAQIYGGGVNDRGAATTFVSNDTFGNTPDEYSPADPTGTSGNISVSPSLVGRAADGRAGFMPRSDSPLLERADSGYPSTIDLRGVPRPVDGNADGVARADIGARENEGITGLRHDGVVWVWDLGLHEPMDYRVYRGDLATLRDTGEYTQDPSAVPGARHFCDVGPALFDGDDPATGRGFFYVVVAWGQVEGTLGFDGSPAERVRTRGCIGP